MTEELKSCPFCGGKAKAVEVAPLIFSAGCDVCRAEVGAEEDRSAAIAAWNRRATPAPAQPEDASTDKYCAECRKTKGADPAKGAQEDEPVALVDKRNGNLSAHWTDRNAAADLEHGTPLYLHPSRSARAAAPASSSSSQPPELSEQAPGLSRAAAPVEGAAWQPIESVPGTTLPLLLRTRGQVIRLETGWHARNLLDAAKEEGDQCNYEAWMHLPVGALPAAPKEKP